MTNTLFTHTPEDEAIEQLIIAEFHKLYAEYPHPEGHSFESMPTDLNSEVKDVLFQCDNGGYFTEDFIEAVKSSPELNLLAADGDIDFGFYEQGGTIPFIVIVEYGYRTAEAFARSNASASLASDLAPVAYISGFGHGNEEIYVDYQMDISDFASAQAWFDALGEQYALGLAERLFVLDVPASHTDMTQAKALGYKVVIAKVNGEHVH